MSTDKAPADKLPLAVRKNVRDGWENKKGEVESQISTLLGGEAWKFDINPLAVWPYAPEGSYGNTSLGDCLFAYAEGFVYYLKYYLDAHGENGVAELNSVVSNHTITMICSKTFSYCGTDIADGNLRLNFSPDYLGSNISSVAENLADAVSKAPQPAGAPSLSFAARAGVKKDYDEKIGDILEKCQKILQNPNLKFEPDFNALGAALKGGKDVRDDWERNLGSFALAYYESFKDVLEREKFSEDEMLREGFEEGVPEGIVKLRIAEKIKESYSEIVLDGGALVIQTIPASWGTNISYAAEKLVNIL